MPLIPLHTTQTGPQQSPPFVERYEKNIGMISHLFRFTTNLFDNTFKIDFDTGFPLLHTHYSELEGAAK